MNEQIMPELKGSEKQVAWANEIRDLWLATLAAQKQKEPVIEIAKKAISRIDQAKWFIDHRDAGWKVGSAVSQLLLFVGDEDFDWVLENTRKRTGLDIRKEDIPCE